MNRIFFLRILLPSVLVLISISTLRGTPENLAISPIGVTDFDFRGKTAKDKIETIKGIGFNGIAMFLNGDSDIKKLNEYLAVQPDLKLIAGLYVNDHKAKLNPKQLEAVVNKLAEMDATLWLIMKGDASDEVSVVKRIQEIADNAAEKKVPVCLYPHDGVTHTYTTAEQALIFLKKADRPNLSLSFHLCHELRAGNGKRLGEAIAAVKPYIKLVTISGANHKVTPGNKDWSDAIKPLSEGDFDTSTFLSELNKAGYSGPIILHTFGLQKKPATHYKESFDTYQKLAKKTKL